MVTAGSELAVDMLMRNKHNITLFNVYLSVAGSSMVLSESVHICDIFQSFFK